MILKIWNIRGVGNPQSQQLASFYKKSKKLDILVLLEPLVQLNEPLFCRLLGFEKIQKNLNSKIWVCSSSNFKISVLKDEEQFQHCSLESLDLKQTFLATFVYAKCTRRERREIWDGISDLVISPSTPWCIGGILTLFYPLLID